MPVAFTMLVNNCLAALHWRASRSGADIVEDTVVHIDRDKKEVQTKGGGRFSFSNLIITAGPWTNQVLSNAGLPGVPMIVSNEQTVELGPRPGAPSYDWDVFPVFTWSEAGYKGRGKDGGCEYFYTTPHVTHPGVPSGGVKIGFHRQGPLLNTDEFQVSSGGKAAVDKLPHIRKELNSEQQFELDTFAWERVQDFVRKKMPSLNAEQYVGYMRCLYQCTPDLHMILGRHPADPSIVFACGFSGSGFQFAPAIANVLAALIDNSVTEQQSAILKKFDPGRFQL
ncbi:soxA [Symbiodinium natans]|uniref:SoxA protein n=1 Tax=Symbiodinium natans TaxID=878477 RepID=A0A812IAM3_9DINO|nr:soxA [Symbiodinium natans]